MYHHPRESPSKETETLERTFLGTPKRLVASDAKQSPGEAGRSAAAGSLAPRPPWHVPNAVETRVCPKPVSGLSGRSERLKVENCSWFSENYRAKKLRERLGTTKAKNQSVRNDLWREQSPKRHWSGCFSKSG